MVDRIHESTLAEKQIANTLFGLWNCCIRVLTQTAWRYTRLDAGQTTVSISSFCHIGHRRTEIDAYSHVYNPFYLAHG